MLTSPEAVKDRPINALNAPPAQNNSPSVPKLTTILAEFGGEEQAGTAPSDSLALSLMGPDPMPANVPEPDLMMNWEDLAAKYGPHTETEQALDSIFAGAGALPQASILPSRFVQSTSNVAFQKLSPLLASFHQPANIAQTKPISTPRRHHAKGFTNEKHLRKNHL